jgi:hypothetical protein
MQLHDLVIFYQSANLDSLESSLNASAWPRLVDIAWPNDSTKANEIHAKLFDNVKDSNGCVKLMSSVQSMSELKAQDLEILLKHVSAQCGYNSEDHERLKAFMNLLSMVRTLIEASNATDTEDGCDLMNTFEFMGCDAYEFLMAGFNPGRVRAIDIDISSVSQLINESFSDIIYAFYN